jgi:hypothetical protein
MCATSCATSRHAIEIGPEVPSGEGDQRRRREPLAVAPSAPVPPRGKRRHGMMPTIVSTAHVKDRRSQASDAI